MFRSGICLFLFVLLSVSVALAGIPPAYAQTPPAEPTPLPTPVPEEPEEETLAGDYVPGQLLIRFKPGVTREQISDFYAEYGLAERDNLDRNPSDNDEELKLAAVQLEINVQ